MEGWKVNIQNEVEKNTRAKQEAKKDGIWKAQEESKCVKQNIRKEIMASKQGNTQTHTHLKGKKQVRKIS